MGGSKKKMQIFIVLTEDASGHPLNRCIGVGAREGVETVGKGVGETYVSKRALLSVINTGNGNFTLSLEYIVVHVIGKKTLVCETK